MSKRVAEIRKRRLTAGLYEVTTPLGACQVLRHSESGEWYVTYPGADEPGDVTSTLTGAVDLIEAWVALEAPRQARYEAADRIVIGFEPCENCGAEDFDSCNPPAHAEGDGPWCVGCGAEAVAKYEARS